MAVFLKPSFENGSKIIILALAVLFLLFEYLNFKCHLVLKNLRKEGSTDRGVPSGWGFDKISCANYFWETCAWSTFAILTKVWGSWLFMGVSTI